MTSGTTNEATTKVMSSGEEMSTTSSTPSPHSSNGGNSAQAEHQNHPQNPGGSNPNSNNPAVTSAGGGAANESQFYPYNNYYTNLRYFAEKMAKAQQQNPQQPGNKRPRLDDLAAEATEAAAYQQMMQQHWNMQPQWNHHQWNQAHGTKIENGYQTPKIENCHF